MKLKTLYDNEIREQKEGGFIDSKLLAILVIAFIISDFFSLFSVIDAVFYQSIILSVLVTATTAILLEVLPVLGAKFLMMPARKSKDNYMLIALGVGFLILVAAISYLRFNSQEIMFSSSDSQLIINGVNNVNDTYTYTASDSEQAMTVLMALLPVLTSMAAFFLTLMDPQSVKLKNLMKRNKIMLKDELVELMTQEDEIKHELEIDLFDRDEQLYNNVLKEIDHYGELMKCRVRELCAEFLGTAQAVSDLLETRDVNKEDTKFVSTEEETQRQNVA